MPLEPTTNDFLDLIRPPLDAAIGQLHRDIKAIESQQAAKGQTGSAIRSALDASQRQFDTNALRTFGEVERVAATTKLDRNELRPLAVQALANFLNAIKSVMERFKRHAQGAAGPIAVIDKEMLALEQSLALMTRQFETGLLDLQQRGDPQHLLPARNTNATVEGARVTFSGAGAHTAEPADSSSQASLAGRGGLQVEARVVEAVGTATTRRSPPIVVPMRDRAEDAERLTRALAQAVKQEIKRLAQERRNDPEAASAIDFLTMVSKLLDEIADAIHAAREVKNEAQQDEKYLQAETLAESLALACRDYAQDNYKRVIDFGGNTLFVLLGTGLFTTLFGVSPDLAFAGQFALLNLIPSPKK